jgi:ABC-type oligopeptide transport system substrate-binding subunit
MSTRPRGLRRAVSVLAVLATLSASVAFSAPAEKFTFAATGYYQFDPALVSTAVEERVCLSCLEGLTRLDPVTGTVVPGVAEKWAVSPDGKEWTFTLRADAKWAKRPGGKFEVVGPVTAQDFVESWVRLLDPEETKSPNARILDVIPEAKAFSTGFTRAVKLGDLAAGFKGLLGKKAGLKGEDVWGFVNDPENACRFWCCDMKDPAVQAWLAWKEGNAMEPAKVNKVVAQLEAASKTASEAYQEAKANLLAGKGFVRAVDAKTLVVRVPGHSPWLPSLLARAPLAAVHTPTIREGRKNAFETYYFTGNGPYLMAGDYTSRARPESMEPQFFKVKLEKNTSYWNAKAVKTPRVEAVIDLGGDEVLRLYGVGDVQWATSDAIGADFAKVKAPAEKASADVLKAAKDKYEVGTGNVFFLRFRCDRAPLDKAGARRALAALVDRAALVKFAGTSSPGPMSRMVPARTTGVSSNVPVPTWAATEAKTLAGGALAFPDGWLTLVSSSDGPSTSVANALAKRWAKEFGFETNNATSAEEDIADSEDDLPGKIRGGAWNAVLTTWTPTFDDPLAFLAAYTTGNVTGSTGWSDPAYDALIAGAFDVSGFATKGPGPELKDYPEVKSLADKAKGSPADLEALRRRLLHEAETLLLREAVVVPIWLPTEAGIVKPSVTGLSLGASGRSITDVHLVDGATFEK